MAKKKTTVRRVPRTATPRTFGDGMPSRPEAPAAEAVRPNGVPVAPAVPQARRPAVTRFGETRVQLPLSQEYHYVPADLRRLAVLALSTFAVLLILGFVIR